MALRDLFSRLNVTQLLAPANRTADANSTSIDTRGYDSLMLVGTVGAPGDTLSGTVLIELEVQHSDDNSAFTACADADLHNAVSGATNTGTFARITANGQATARFITGYRGTKRYVRVVDNRTGTHTTGTPTGVVAVQGHAHLLPVN